MKKQTVFALLAVLALALSSCGTTPSAAPTTPTLLPTQQTVIPTNITYPTSTSTPLATAILYSTLEPIQTEPIQTEIPYPTASVVNANAVAFIERDNENHLSLWVANVDGSGERKIVDSIGEWSDNVNYFLRWSPHGKWISYISNDELWIVSPDGSEKKKVLPPSDNNKRLMSYNWAPDDSQVAYSQASLRDSKFNSVSIRILELKTGEIYEISSQKPQPYGTITRWSPNGQLLAFNNNASFIIFDVVNHKVKKEILIDNSHMCSGLDNTAPVWSPDSKWFFHFHGSGSAAVFWTCISNLDGENYPIDTHGSISRPVWNKTGELLYFVAEESNPNSNSLEVKQQLLQYNVKTKKIEHLFSLDREIYQSIWSVSISPDGNTLEAHAGISETQQSYNLIDLKSLTITKNFTLEFGCVWSSDSENFICLSQPNGYTTFHRLNIQTNRLVAFSGEHKMASWAVSPVATTP